MKRLLVYSLSAAILFFYSCEEGNDIPNIDTEKEIIAQTISSCIGWFKDKDFDKDSLPDFLDLDAVANLRLV